MIKKEYAWTFRIIEASFHDKQDINLIYKSKIESHDPPKEISLWTATVTHIYSQL